MERFFYRRGKKIVVTEVDGVLAVKMKLDAARKPIVPFTQVGTLAVNMKDARPSITLNQAEEKGFSEAGWFFVRPTAEMSGAASRGEAPTQVEEMSKVYRGANGRVLLATKAIILQFDAAITDAEAKSRMTKLGLRLVRELKFAPNQYEVSIPAGADLLTLANALHERPDTVFAEPNFNEYMGQRLTPTDPSFGQQWHHNNTGAGGGTAGADISSEEAWDFTRGRGARIAVIDNGFDVAHEDLAPGLTATTGFFAADGTFRQTRVAYPGGAHGTFCAGMAAARHNNARGGCGSAPESELMLVACLADQVGTQATLARALAYAANPSMEVAGSNPSTGADVIVSSLGPNGAVWDLTTVLENAINFTTNLGRKGKGTPIFWACSNGNNVDIAQDEVVSHPRVIAVGRSRNTDLEDNCARGEELEFLAPGVNVFSTRPGNTYNTDTGTSYAAPLAAGVGALLLSINPNLRWQEVRKIMCDTCDKIGGVAYNAQGHHNDYGHGRVNAFRAVIHAMQSLNQQGIRDADVSGTDPSEIPVTSPWGIGTLAFDGGTMTARAMAPNGTRFGGWLLNTADNNFDVMGDFDGDGKAEILVVSPWGIGVLKQTGSTYTCVMLAPNGTRFGGWLLNTGDNRFGPVGDFDGDGRMEILVTSPWGVGILKLSGTTFTVPMMAPNGTRFGGWLLNTADNWFGPVGNFDNTDRKQEILVRSPWGIAILKLNGTTFSQVMIAANGTRFGGWLLNTNDNWFGPVGQFDADTRDEVVIASPWGIGILKFNGASLTPVMMAPNGTRFGGWLLNTFDNRLRAAADFDGDGRAEILITSPWGIGVLKLSGATLAAPMMAPNGTRFGGWLLNTADNHFRRFQDMNASTRADILVESPWGIGIMELNGATFNVPFMQPNGTRFGGWLLNTNDNMFY